MSDTNYEATTMDIAEVGAPTDLSLSIETADPLDLSASTCNRALRDAAHEELALVRRRYIEHRDPVRCAVGISLVLRSLASDLYGEERVNRLRRVSWLNFLLRTSNPHLLGPHVIETMSAALYGDPPDMEPPGDCSFWFEAAEGWITHQRNRRPQTTCQRPIEVNL